MKISIRKALMIGGVCIFLAGALIQMPAVWKAAAVLCGIVCIAIGKVMEE